ncbi:MAG: hypothetical protein Q8O72_05605 [Bacteroidales bacterium]|nr:hypothetical protein [Bacteroidales bacterium]
MIFGVLTGIFVLFVLFVFIRGRIYQRFGVKICAVCAAVSLTWIALVVLKIFGIQVSNVLLGILMGESVAGVMHLFDNLEKKEGTHRMSWVKVFIILAGTLLVYLFLIHGFSVGLMIGTIFLTLFGIIIYRTVKGQKSKEIVHNNYGKFKQEIEKLEERFDRCCD